MLMRLRMLEISIGTVKVVKSSADHVVSYTRTSEYPCIIVNASRRCTSAMDLRRERKRSLKVREQQEAELERIQATKKRYSRGIDVTISFYY